MEAVNAADVFLRDSPSMRDERKAVELDMGFDIDFRGLTLMQILMEFAFLHDIGEM